MGVKGGTFHLSVIVFKPEGEWQSRHTKEEVQRAAETGALLEGRAILCDEEGNLTVDLGCCKGFMPHAECAVGIDTGETKHVAVITRVGRKVCFKVTGFDGDTPLLSRRAAQEDCIERYISQLRIGDIIPCTVTRLAGFGAFVDIGCGLPSLITIDNLSISRISHPSDRVEEGQQLMCVVKGRESPSRISLSQKELLGTWEENAARFSVGQTVVGTVRGVESYGIFIELAPNLAGLAESQDGVAVGDVAVVYIKSIMPERMKIKLVISESFKGDGDILPLEYFIEGGHLDRWVYSPASCNKVIESVFTEET